MTNNLKPCPFCGSEDVLYSGVEGLTRDICSVFCNHCGVTTDFFETKSEAETAWNKRANSKKGAEENDYQQKEV